MRVKKARKYVVLQTLNVASPTTFWTLGDSINYLLIQTYTFYGTPTTGGALHLRHLNGGNVLFLDGHVRNIKRNEARELGILKGYLSNNTMIDF